MRATLLLGPDHASPPCQSPWIHKVFALSHLWNRACPGVPLQAVEVPQHIKKAWRVLRQIGRNRTLRIRVGPKLHGIFRACDEASTNTIQQCRPILEGSSELRELFLYSNRRRSSQTNQILRQKQIQARITPAHFPRPTPIIHHALLFLAVPNAAQSARKKFTSSPLFTASISKSSL
jgi:hypothetical protein